MNKVKVGVIGCGVMGQNHLKVYSRLSDVEILGISDINEVLVNALAQKYKTKAYLNYKNLLEAELDAVSVVVPTTLHKEVALSCIEAGVNLLVEKPIADTISAAREIAREAKKKNLKLLVGHIERFNPAIAKLREIIKSDILGKIASISSRRVGPYTPRTYDVGVIIDLGTHDIDIISYLYEEKVREVYAVAGSQIHSFEDHASVMLRFNNGNAGVVETNWLTPHKVRKLSVVGLSGVASLDFLEQRVTIYDRESKKELKVVKCEPLYKELEHFVNVVKGKELPLVNGEDSIHALTVALSAVESYKKGRVIKIEEDSYKIDDA